MKNSIKDTNSFAEKPVAELTYTKLELSTIFAFLT